MSVATPEFVRGLRAAYDIIQAKPTAHAFSAAADVQAAIDAADVSQAQALPGELAQSVATYIRDTVLAVQDSIREANYVALVDGDVDADDAYQARADWFETLNLCAGLLGIDVEPEADDEDEGREPPLDTPSLDTSFHDHEMDVGDDEDEPTDTPFVDSDGRGEEHAGIDGGAL